MMPCIHLQPIGNLTLTLNSETPLNVLSLLEGDPGIEPGTFGSGDQRSLH